MLRSVIENIKADKDYPERNYTLDIYNRVLDGAIYEHITTPFHCEKAPNGDYVPLLKRRPSVRTNLCRVVVEDSVSLLFGEGRFPTPEVGKDKDLQQALLAFSKEARLSQIMNSAAMQGSVGSVAIQMRVLEQKHGGGYRAFFKVHSTKFLNPVYADWNPDLLIKIEERYKVEGKALKEIGYDIPDEDIAAKFWFGRDWTEDAEVWWTPWKLDSKDDPVEDKDRTVKHNLGFCPWVWIKNLPGDLRLVNKSMSSHEAVRYSDIDGTATFAPAIDTVIEIDYLMSQGGRGLRYTMDPMLLLKEPASPLDAGAELVKSPANAVITSEQGDAKLLEISGAGFQTMLQFFHALREVALESVHGNRASPDKLSAAQSGRAMELLNQSLIWLAEKLRASYGEGALVDIFRMVLRANKKFPLTVQGKKWGDFDPDTSIALKWPAWFTPTYQDRHDLAMTLKEHRESHTMSRKTAVQAVAPIYDIEDVDAEVAAIAADEAAQVNLTADTTTQVKINSV